MAPVIENVTDQKTDLSKNEVIWAKKFSKKTRHEQNPLFRVLNPWELHEERNAPPVASLK